MGYLISRLNSSKMASLFELRNSWYENLNLKYLIQKLAEHSVLEIVEQGKSIKYRIKPDAEFFFFRIKKKVSVSEEGHRALRILNEGISLKNNISERIMGSILWTEKSYKPKIRIGPAERLKSFNEDESLPIDIDVIKDKPNNIVFKASFKPPLKAGEAVRFGFYTWTRNHYAKTSKEALERFGDEWLREGFEVREPTDILTLSVKFLTTILYREAKLELNPIIVTGGPNIIGQTQFVFPSGQKVLIAKLHNPPHNRYFISWLTPE